MRERREIPGMTNRDKMLREGEREREREREKRQTDRQTRSHMHDKPV